MWKATLPNKQKRANSQTKSTTNAIENWHIQQWGHLTTSLPRCRERVIVLLLSWIYWKRRLVVNGSHPIRNASRIPSLRIWNTTINLV
jgi:hypothetical protein